jgi:hypothetical protein
LKTSPVSHLSPIWNEVVPSLLAILMYTLLVMSGESDLPRSLKEFADELDNWVIPEQPVIRVQTPFEEFKERRAQEQLQRQNREEARQAEWTAIEAKILAHEARRQETIRAKRDAERRIHEARHQLVLAFREESGIVNKLRALRELAPESQFQHDALNRWKTKKDPDSVLDKLTWDMDDVGLYTVDSRIEGGYKVTTSRVWHQEKYLLAETFPDGVIQITGGGVIPPVVLGRFVIYDGATVRRKIPRSSWINDPTVFEVPILSAYYSPFYGNHTLKSKSYTSIPPDFSSAGE